MTVMKIEIFNTNGATGLIFVILKLGLELLPLSILARWSVPIAQQDSALLTVD